MGSEYVWCCSTSGGHIELVDKCMLEASEPLFLLLLFLPHWVLQILQRVSKFQRKMVRGGRGEGKASSINFKLIRENSDSQGMNDKLVSKTGWEEFYRTCIREIRLICSYQPKALGDLYHRLPRADEAVGYGWGNEMEVAAAAAVDVDVCHRTVAVDLDSVPRGCS